jgi:hypothetical protein
MVRNDIDICHPKRGGEKVLFHKHIFKNELEARQELQEKNLAPGEIAVARFYVNYSDEYLGGSPSYDAIRMVMAIGGASPHSVNDTYFFNDSYKVSEEDYITKEELEKTFSNYYTKEEIDNIINNIDFPTIDTDNFATKEELNVVNRNIEEVRNIVNSKVDASYVEEYFINNVSNIVGEEIEKQNISQQVSDAVDKKLEKFEGVTTETLDEALQSNEYFTTNVITPIESITEKVNTIETQIKDLDTDIDGGEEEEWEI